MKNFLLIIAILAVSLFAMENEQKSSIRDLPPPGIKAPCTGTNDSFSVYKDTVCGLSGSDILNPRCFELSIKKALGILSDDEVKYYQGEKAIAYLAEKRGK